MKILLTGATGLIGTEVMKTLAAAGHQVTATDRKGGDIPAGVNFILGELTDDKFIESLDFNCDAVVHLGSIPRPFDDQDFEVFDNNVSCTYKVFSKAAANNVKVVILGQDPYHNGSATGLCFDVKLGNALNPSLQNIYKELESEGFSPVKDGNLESWTRQGVLLLNTALTVREGEPESHLELWSDFSDKVIKKLSEKDFVVWIILGKKAADWKTSITNKNHIILEKYIIIQVFIK